MVWHELVIGDVGLEMKVRPNRHQRARSDGSLPSFSKIEKLHKVVDLT